MLFKNDKDFFEFNAIGYELNYKNYGYYHDNNHLKIIFKYSYNNEIESCEKILFTYEIKHLICALKSLIDGRIEHINEVFKEEFFNIEYISMGDNRYKITINFNVEKQLNHEFILSSYDLREHIRDLEIELEKYPIRGYDLYNHMTPENYIIIMQLIDIRNKPEPKQYIKEVFVSRLHEIFYKGKVIVRDDNISIVNKKFTHVIYIDDHIRLEYDELLIFEFDANDYNNIDDYFNEAIKEINKYLNEHVEKIDNRGHKKENIKFIMLAILFLFTWPFIIIFYILAGRYWSYIYNHKGYSEIKYLVMYDGKTQKDLFCDFDSRIDFYIGNVIKEYNPFFLSELIEKKSGKSRTEFFANCHIISINDKNIVLIPFPRLRKLFISKNKKYKKIIDEGTKLYKNDIDRLIKKYNSILEEKGYSNLEFRVVVYNNTKLEFGESVIRVNEIGNYLKEQ